MDEDEVMLTPGPTEAPSGIFTATGTPDRDELVGGPHGDTFSGAAGNDSIYGFGGGDVINGGDGEDLIEGGDGDDVINGEAGNDHIESGNGDDIVEGGGDPDTFVIEPGEGKDIILDFEVHNENQDTIMLFGFPTGLTYDDHVAPGITFDDGNAVIDLSAYSGTVDLLGPTPQTITLVGVPYVIDDFFDIRSGVLT
jgi:Ca2+-binding RTX toxin-like protein